MAQALDENYVKVTHFKDPFQSTQNVPAASMSQTVTYFDGLGRPIQQVAGQQSPEGKDIVTHIEYDALGRQAREYLPYPSTNAALEFTDSQTAMQATLTHYQSAYGDANPYSEKLFEASPLSRVLKQASPGNDWIMGAGHEIREDYLANSDSDAVRRYIATTGPIVNGYYSVTLSQASSYLAGQLYKSVAKDENWTSGTLHTTEEFINKEGQTVLKRTFNEVPASGPQEERPVTTVIALDTYYVYDMYGNLSYVLPPLSDHSGSEPDLAGLCYQYRYDGRNRLVEKKLPGKDWEYIAYDKLDRVAATGPGLNPYGGGTKGWLITKYDIFSRPAYSAWYSGTAATSEGRAGMQAQFNGATLLSESRVASGTVDSINIGYTNGVFPTDPVILLSASYYDDYGFPDAAPIPPIAAGSKKGLLTGSWTRVLTLPSENFAEIATVFYDAKARPVRTYLKNWLGGYTLTDNSIDFSGKTLSILTEHKRLNGDTPIVFREDFSYTGQDRLLTHTHQITSPASNPVQLLAKNDYDQLGQLVKKSIGGIDITGNTALQKAGYAYNIRGWLTGINTGLQDPTDPDDLFVFELGYNSPSTAQPLYNGNISETRWMSASDMIKRKYNYSYDALNRLKEAAYLKYDQNYQSTDAYNEALEYDSNGNITRLRRKGNNDGAVGLEIDNLTYAYSQQHLNRLMRVTDGSEDPNGFKDGTNTGDDYGYDDYGNMTSDLNKGIISIDYNHLNLPIKITFANGIDNISYLYDGAGNKLRKTITYDAPQLQGGMGIRIMDYLSGFQYDGKTLLFFPTAEGYVNHTSGQFHYVYNYTDHLGNIRLSYGVDPQTNALKIMEENNFYPFGLKHANYNVDRRTYQEKEREVVLRGAPVTAPRIVFNYDYKYNGKEFQDELGLNLYDYGWRQYDPAIGRFNKIDRFAEKYVDASPYHYSANNPVAFRDMAGDSIKTKFYDQDGKALKSIPSAIQKMFNNEFGIKVGYNAKTNMLYYAGEHDSELSQSESATNGLVDALKDTNTGKNDDKHGTLLFGYNMRGVKGGDVDGGQWNRTGGLYNKGVTQIDLADFDSQGKFKNMNYSSTLDPRAFNLARVFEHEYLGGHQKFMIGGFGDGNEYTMGKVVEATNLFARERNLPERLHYGNGIIFFGRTLQYGSQGEQRKAVKSMVNGTTANNLFVKPKN